MNAKRDLPEFIQQKYINSGCTVRNTTEQLTCEHADGCKFSQRRFNFSRLSFSNHIKLQWRFGGVFHSRGFFDFMRVIYSSKGCLQQ